VIERPKSCAECQFFSVFENATNGECRRKAPTFIVTSEAWHTADPRSGFFPEIEGDRWCGAGERRDDGAEPHTHLTMGGEVTCRARH
jgi:hypothetical protein